jgi:hypothetical protein
LRRPRPALLILAHVGDETAVRVTQALRRRPEGRRVEVVTPEELALAPAWEHRIDNAGPRGAVRLARGEVLDRSSIAAVFNRLRFVTMPHFLGLRDDYDYAVTEMYALVLSWIGSLPCPVINRPDPRGLGGPERSFVEWLALAGAAGLPTRRLAFATNARSAAFQGMDVYSPITRFAPGQANRIPRAGRPLGKRPALYLQPVLDRYQTATVVDDSVLNAPTEELASGCLRVAKSSGCELLDLTFAARTRDNGDRPSWCIVDVNPFPEPRHPTVVDAITTLLARRAATTDAGGQ